MYLPRKKSKFGSKFLKKIVGRIKPGSLLHPPFGKRLKFVDSFLGLRHFSMKVCEKVQAKGLTSYNEVADELVSELTDPR